MKKKILSIVLCMAMLLSSAFFVSATENFGELPHEVKLDSSTAGLTAVGNTTIDTWYANLYSSGGMTYTFTANAAKSYILDLVMNSGVAATLDVKVNGVLVADDVVVPVNGWLGGSNLKQKSFAKIDVVEGTNTITVTRSSDNLTFADGNQVQLAKLVFGEAKEDITSNPFEIPINNTTVPEGKYYNCNAASYAMAIWKGGWIEYTINTAETKNYSLDLRLGMAADGATVDIVVNGTTVVAGKALPNTGGPDYLTNVSMGIVTLNAGTNVIRVNHLNTATASVYISLRKIILTESEEDITANPMIFAVNQNTISAEYGANSTAGSVAIWSQVQGYFEYTISTLAEKTYYLTVSSGNTGNGSAMDVYLNGTKVIAAHAMPNTGNAGILHNEKLGEITLKPGTNVLKFQNLNKETAVNSYLNIDKFTLTEKKEDLTSLPATFNLNKNTANVTNAVNSDASCVVLWRLNSFEYTVYTTKAATYNMQLHVGTAMENAKADISVNGVKVFSNFSIPQTADSWHREFVDIGLVNLVEGANVIKVEHLNTETTASATHMMLDKIVFEEPDYGNQVIIKSFGIESADGARMPAVVIDGMTGYAAVTLEKFGTVDDDMLLFIAQYSNDSRMIDVAIEPVSVSKMADKEVKKFTSELAYKGNGGYVKAFLMDAKSQAPLSEAKIYIDTQIFPDDVLDTVVTSELATTVLNNDGELYTEYGIHNDQYDIDAIFYNGSVTKGVQTKVFAYIGIPKNATAENPVPGMVLVHGGHGKAYIDWVKSWNDRGYAAIAMDLYGTGPEADPSNTYYNEMKIHPYAGMDPFGSEAWSTDYRNAGMYQNVVNVINAHNLLRSYAEVDTSKIGITGSSWGGITTNIVAGVDNRFLFKAPVYGGGYPWQFEKMEYAQDFVAQSAWDPINFIAKTNMPSLLSVSDMDANFTIRSSSLSYGMMNNGYFSVIHGWAHSDYEARTRAQVYDFADIMIGKTADSNIKINSATAEDGVFTVDATIPATATVTKAYLYYMTDAAIPSNSWNNNWKIVTAYTNNDGTFTFDIPEDATYGYASIFYNNNAIMSTKFIELK